MARPGLASILAGRRRTAFRPVAVPPPAAALLFVRDPVRFAASVLALQAVVVNAVLVIHGLAPPSPCAPVSWAGFFTKSLRRRPGVLI